MRGRARVKFRIVVAVVVVATLLSGFLLCVCVCACVSVCTFWGAARGGGVVRAKDLDYGFKFKFIENVECLHCGV